MLLVLKLIVLLLFESGVFLYSARTSCRGTMVERMAKEVSILVMVSRSILRWRTAGAARQSTLPQIQVFKACLMSSKGWRWVSDTGLRALSGVGVTGEGHIVLRANH